MSIGTDRLELLIDMVAEHLGDCEIEVDSPESVTFRRGKDFVTVMVYRDGETLVVNSQSTPFGNQIGRAVSDLNSGKE